MLSFMFRLLTASAAVFALLVSLSVAAEETEVTDLSATKKIEEINAEIQRLNEELEQITAASEPVAEVEEAPKLWSGDLEFGYFESTGNTEESSIKGKADINREKEQWRYNIFFESLSSDTDGDRTAEKYFLSNRLAYQFTEKNYAFAYASYEDDHFSGYDYQATVAAGYGRRIMNEETMHWDVEVGPGYRESKVDEDSTEEDTDEVILRMFSKYKWDFSENATFSQTVSVEAGDENTVSRSITSLSTRVVGALLLKLSYTVKYSEEVPVDTKHADTETSVTLAYSF
ncbi:DUF481 domain-containing protein [Oceanicoccus sp. KOV_DT_Chl]|uniref:DUF481 domain-containing protein n=1 Tax=Oceanicoccus sp. KOV_DT_Chl TaxID=1904639 RepID=UPI000C7ABCB0|nr:DUF481 domain-containing protein [Oceanicoccus sp. KOV_DT_Chl]